MTEVVNIERFTASTVNSSKITVIPGILRSTESSDLVPGKIDHRPDHRRFSIQTLILGFHSIRGAHNNHIHYARHHTTPAGPETNKTTTEESKKNFKGFPTSSSKSKNFPLLISRFEICNPQLLGTPRTPENKPKSPRTPSNRRKWSDSTSHQTVTTPSVTKGNIYSII